MIYILVISVLGVVALTMYVYPLLTLVLCTLAGVGGLLIGACYRHGRRLWLQQCSDHERIDHLIEEYIASWARLHPGRELPVSLKHVEAVRTLGISGVDQVIQRMQDHLGSDIAEISDSWQGRFDAAIALYNQHAEVWNDFVHGRIARYAQHIVPSWHRVPYL